MNLRPKEIKGTRQLPGSFPGDRKQYRMRLMTIDVEGYKHVNTMSREPKASVAMLEQVQLPGRQKRQ
jgi:hypothetical protein